MAEAPKSNSERHKATPLICLSSDEEDEITFIRMVASRVVAKDEPGFSGERSNCANTASNSATNASHGPSEMSARAGSDFPKSSAKYPTFDPKKFKSMQAKVAASVSKMKCEGKIKREKSPSDENSSSSEDLKTRPLTPKKISRPDLSTSAMMSPLDKLKQKNTSSKKRTPVNRKPFSSPYKDGVFGSPSKSTTQLTLTPESFSPKKSCKSLFQNLEVCIESAPHMPPLHASPAVKSCTYRKATMNQNTMISEFTESHMDFIDAVKGQGFTMRYLETVSSFLSVSIKPPANLVYMLCDTLLQSKSQSASDKCFWILKRIMELHPNCFPGRQERFGKLNEKKVQSSIDWCLITSIVEQMLGKPCLSSSNALKALAFLVNVMETEVKIKQFAILQTTAYRLLSVERSPRNVTEVIGWIQSSLNCSDCSYGVPFSPMSLLYRLLQLSITVSKNQESCVDHLSSELLSCYLQLQSLSARTQLLQSIQSHLLRWRLADLVLIVSCKSETGDEHATGISKIITQHFKRLPPKQGSTLSQECNVCLRNSEEVEEFIALLAYSMQSYLFCYHKKLRGECRKAKLCRTDGTDNEENSSDHDEYFLSFLDLDTLCNMGEEVIMLHGRAMSLCPYLTQRTQQLLSMLELGEMWHSW
ncbi:uncharacterized protein LOC116615998 isoform X2 [Nematostella vectensis]|uniref:uncharacterized protein LOC116615998 isoform X2 n=1 Tax=Nematostella vectensis TaxID=45351 RepID=UPI0020779883|nr:uncharacterized protein LOC116615998 isoform X2 [Nematostella vectensis]